MTDLEPHGVNTVVLSGWLSVDEVNSLQANPHQGADTFILARLHLHKPCQTGELRLGGYNLLLTGKAAERLFESARQSPCQADLPRVLIRGYLFRPPPFDNRDMLVRVTYLDIL